ncbi:unnamed protein product [Paramecium octaurelia]|uniref:Uncharacterized protein n=1 Tax=Paramecium octaurelia TaxID=43137 RepID=A0A8S1TE40_PAROT|nr:unnamed protein product [Paramecium octaurelia]
MILFLVYGLSIEQNCSFLGKVGFRISFITNSLFAFQNGQESSFNFQSTNKADFKRR